MTREDSAILDAATDLLFGAEEEARVNGWTLAQTHHLEQRCGEILARLSDPVLREIATEPLSALRRIAEM